MKLYYLMADFNQIKIIEIKYLNPITRRLLQGLFSGSAGSASLVYSVSSSSGMTRRATSSVLTPRSIDQIALHHKTLHHSYS